MATSRFVVGSLILKAFVLFAQSQFPAASASEHCVVSGIVTNVQTGSGIKRAQIWLSPISADKDAAAAIQMAMLGHGSAAGRAKYSALSENDSSFCFLSVAPGQYTMTGSKLGFLDTNYGANYPTESGKIVAVGSGSSTTLTLALIPQSVISGKVTDAQDEPLRGVTISLLLRMVIGSQIRNVPVRAGQSDDLGDFRLANVAPGAYNVVAEPGSGARSTIVASSRPLRTFYPGVASMSQATPIIVGPGEQRTGVDIRLLNGSTHHIRGTLVGLEPSDHGSISIRPLDEEQVFVAFGGSNYKPDGSFEFADIGPGTYVLTYVQVGGDTAKGARRVVDVGDRDVNDVVLPITSSAVISGILKVDGDTVTSKPVDFQKVRVNLDPADTLVGPNARAAVESDGRFAIRNIVPGRYVVHVDPLPGAYLKSVRYGQTDVRGQVLDLTGVGSGEMEVVFRYGLATLTGTVQSEDGAHTSSRVVLVPAVLGTDGKGVILATSDPGGAFEIGDVPPGAYRAYAFESVDFAGMREPEVLKALQSSGTELELGEGEQRSVVLNLIRSEDERHMISTAMGRQ